MLKSLLLSALGLLFFMPVFAQKTIEMADIHRWRKIDQPQLSADGKWAAYTVAPQTEGDNQLCLYNTKTRATVKFERSSDARFSDDCEWLAFRTKPALDSLKALRRKKVKDDDLPKDTLVLYRLSTGAIEKYPRVKAFTMPEKWSGLLLIHLEAPGKPAEAKKDTAKTKPPVAPADTTKKETKPAPKPKTDAAKTKKEGKETGTTLLIRQLASGQTDTVPFVLRYAVAEKSPALAVISTGNTDTLPARKRFAQNGVYYLDGKQMSWQPLRRGKGKYQDLTLSADGRKVAFLADNDTTKAQIRPWQLCIWETGIDSARVANLATVSGLNAADTALLNMQQNAPLPMTESLSFCEDGSKLFFGLAPRPILPDTTMLPEEVVNVEVWAGSTPHLYTEYKKNLDAEKKRSVPAVLHWFDKHVAMSGSPKMPELRLQMQPLLRNADWALAFDEEPYAVAQQWEGEGGKDVYSVDLNTGAKTVVARNLHGDTRVSPYMKYALWWSRPDSAWVIWQKATGKTITLTDNRSGRWNDEESDTPDYPDPYGVAGWVGQDEGLILYDRYDLWLFDPSGLKKPERLTNGRPEKMSFRYLRLDPEERSIPTDGRLLLHTFRETDKQEGYRMFSLKNRQFRNWQSGAYAYSRTPVKARRSDDLLYTFQNISTFPDLYHDVLPPMDFGKMFIPQRVSDANPQQKEYRWSTVELVQWRSLQGDTLQGMLYKPVDFDPKRKYPMVVNFYEKSSDGLHVHHAPNFGRSQISYTQYVSRGYIVFVPDITYRIGYPGESAYDAVVSGVNHVLSLGFVDQSKVALQGHSWGGYQAAYLVTRTNMFRCAEAGAPVANMTSAYGGIRWESGRNRQFQYEHQQSRIGGSLWEKPKQYLENSPLFALDKVHTPLLILHNDADGAVPWQQGIELFTGLRRLGQPVWMLNYNEEPHWPVKLQNRIDFQTRMQQFFDYYLLDKPMPKWMQQGVPPIEKGVRRSVTE